MSAEARSSETVDLDPWENVCPLAFRPGALELPDYIVARGCLGGCFCYRWEREGVGSTIRGKTERFESEANNKEENPMTTSLTPDTNELRKISELPTELALRQAASFLARLVKDPDFLESRVLPLLGEARDGEDWYVAHRHGAEDGSISLKVFVWPPGTGTRIHDHSSWGAYCCAIGSVFEERYERLDDGSHPNHARLKKIWQLWWSPEDGASTVLPRDGGIHRIGNPGGSTAISVHFYGPRTGEVDGRDYDPSRDHVCDRQEG